MDANRLTKAKRKSYSGARYDAVKPNAARDPVQKGFLRRGGILHLWNLNKKSRDRNAKAKLERSIKNTVRSPVKDRSAVASAGVRIETSALENDCIPLTRA